MRCRRMMFPASIWIKSNKRAGNAYLQARKLWDRIVPTGLTRPPAR